MKKNDLAVLLAIIGITSLFSYFLAGALFNPSKNKLKVEVVDTIYSTFPDSYSDKYKLFFNKDSLNPTQVITVGGNNPGSGLAPTTPTVPAKVITPPAATKTIKR
jgi:hypothetical protein